MEENGNGGNIFLSVSDDGTILGADESAIVAMKKDFVNLCNNNQKIELIIYLNIREYKVGEKSILHVYVNESSSVHKTNGIIYDRNIN